MRVLHFKSLHRGCCLAAASALILLLSGCGGGYRQPVVAPSSSTPVAASSQRPPQPYSVNGRVYQPMSHCDGFVQEGIASWYGPDFHGKKTSSGEVYDMYGMTAAHKTLPLGTSLRVTNKSNGRQVVVRVNDRGPFVGARILDLSYAAAQHLGVVGPGTAPVRIEALGVAHMDAGGHVTYEAAASYEAGSYAVQIGAFTVGDNARRLAEKYRRQLGHASIQTGRIEGRLFYRVWVGRYDSLSAAYAARDAFGQAGYGSSFVVALD